MVFPVFYNGKVLFRDGSPAMSVACCCDNCNLTQYQDYAICYANNDEAEGKADPADPPWPPCGLIYYEGRVRDTLGPCEGTPPVPAGYYYYGYLWLLRICYYEGGIERLDFEQTLSQFTADNTKYQWYYASTTADEIARCLSTPINGPCDPEGAAHTAPDLVEHVVGDETTTPPDCPACEKDC